MFVVHALWSAEHGLGLWSEDSELKVKSPSQAMRSARPHPFAAPVPESVVGQVGKTGTVTLLLPSLRSAPLDSPELVRVAPRPAATTAPTLFPWSVPTTWVAPELAAATLADLFTEHEDAVTEDFRLGASVRFLTTLAEFADDLVERRRVLPDLVWGEAWPIACWRPVLQGQDAVTAHALVAAMPPVCRAETAEVGDLTGVRPDSIVTTVLVDLVDAAQRRRLGSLDISVLPPRKGRSSRQLPAAEAWLISLADTVFGGRFEADRAELDVLERELSGWAGVGAGEIGAAKLVFRLAESAGSDDLAEQAWRLEFLVQSVEDPSLQVPAGQVWTQDGALRRWLDRPEELLLSELVRAARVFPELASALNQARPDSLELDADGAYRFLAGGAELLDEAGFGVMLPSWWERRDKLGLVLSASSTPTDGVVAKKSKFGRDQLVNFEWQLAIGDKALTEEELTALAAAKAPLVQIRGQWVAVDAERLRKGMEFLRRKPSGRKPAAELLRLAATHPDDSELPLQLNALQATGWLGDFLDGTVEQSLRPEPAPPGLHAELRPYQERGLAWLAFLSRLGLGACLADDMGLGKTIQLLALEVMHRGADEASLPTLLLCPMSLVGNWQREAAKFTPELRLYAHHGRERLHGDELRDRLAETDVIVTTYATATRDIDELAAYEWQRVVLDEAQAVKNSLARSSVAVRKLQAGQRIALTGTPMENRLAELWSVMDFINPGILSTSQSFRKRYAIPVERDGLSEPVERLRKITRPYLLRRLKTDPQIIDDLPEKIEMKQYCQLTTEQASLYRAVADEMMEKIEDSDGIQRRGNVLAAMTKLKQVCNHPGQLLHDRSPVGVRSGKVIRLEEILTEILDQGEKVLLFSQYTEFSEMLLPHLSAKFDQEVLFLHGGVTKKRRDDMVTRFQSESGPGIFLLSLKAGGTGLNLTAANHVVHLDRWWNPAVENQATDRAFRIGQKRNVQVRKFICVGTLEEKIDEMIEEKKALADLVISDGEGWLTELSTDTLREMFTLSEAGVD
jgi:SNF2 family DNA or RNA helicase